MASDNHIKTHQDNIQRVATPSVLLQMDKIGSGTKQQHTVRLQQKPRQGVEIPEGNPPGLWLRVTGPPQYS